jgi:hypothetical protein
MAVQSMYIYIDMGTIGGHDSMFDDDMGRDWSRRLMANLSRTSGNEQHGRVAPCDADSSLQNQHQRRDSLFSTSFLSK